MLYFLISIGFLALAATAVVWQFSLRRKPSGSARAWEPVDVPSLYMLLDQGESLYLRENLPDPVFRQHHRRRMAVGWGYLRRLSHNARLVVHTGQMMQAMSPSPNAEAQKVVELAVRAQREIQRMRFRVALWYAFPGMQLDLLPGLQVYRDMEATSMPLLRPIEAQAQWVQ